MVDFPLFLLARRYIVLTGKIAERLRELLRQGCKARGIKIIRGGIGSDHVHMLISCPPTLAPCKIMQYLKGKPTKCSIQQKMRVRIQ